MSLKDHPTLAGPLSTTYASAKAAFQRSLMVSKGRADMALSLAGSQAKYQDATGFIELWTDTSSWQVGTATFPVSGQNVYGTTDANATMTRPVPAGTNRYRAVLNTIAGGAEHLSLFGWSNATVGGKGDAYGLLAAGIHRSVGGNTAVNKIVTWNQGTEVQVYDYTPGAILYLTAGQDALYSWAEISGSDGTVIASVKKVKAGGGNFVPTQLGMYLSDARGLTGDFVSRITGRDESVTSTNRSIELLSPCSINTIDKSGGTNIRVSTPIGYDSRKPAPLFLYCHGYGGNADSIRQGTSIWQVTASLLANGYIVASSDAYGGSEVGSGYAAYIDLYKYVRDHYAIGPVIIAGESFGGISATRILSGTDIPDIAGFLAWYPVLNMAAMYASASWVSAAVNTAYGSLAAAQAAGADPALLPGTAFRGVPYRSYHSPSDTTVSKAWNDAFTAKIAPYTTEATVVTTTGGHGDASNFQAADTLAFVNRCIGR